MQVQVKNNNNSRQFVIMIIKRQLSENTQKPAVFMQLARAACCVLLPLLSAEICSCCLVDRWRHGRLSYKQIDIEIRSGKVRVSESCARNFARCAARNYDALAASLGIVNSEFYFACYMRGGFVNWRQNSFATTYLGPVLLNERVFTRINLS